MGRSYGSNQVYLMRDHSIDADMHNIERSHILEVFKFLDILSILSEYETNLGGKEMAVISGFEIYWGTVYQSFSINI